MARDPHIVAKQLAALAGSALIAVTCAGCPFSPAFPVEESEPNFPPLISTDFIAPPSSTVTIIRSGPQVNFSVNQLFDVNEAEQIEIVWFTPHALGGPTVLKTDSSGPDPNNPTLHRDIFHRYTGSSYTLDPCDIRWSEDKRHTLSVFVSDGDIIVPAGEPLPNDGAFVDVFSWSIEFTDECPEF